MVNVKEDFVCIMVCNVGCFLFLEINFFLGEHKHYIGKDTEKSPI